MQQRARVPGLRRVRIATPDAEAATTATLAPAQAAAAASVVEDVQHPTLQRLFARVTQEVRVLGDLQTHVYVAHRDGTALPEALRRWLVLAFLFARSNDAAPVRYATLGEVLRPAPADMAPLVGASGHASDSALVAGVLATANGRLAVDAVLKFAYVPDSLRGRGRRAYAVNALDAVEAVAGRVETAAPRLDHDSALATERALYVELVAKLLLLRVTPHLIAPLQSVEFVRPDLFWADAVSEAAGDVLVNPDAVGAYDLNWRRLMHRQRDGARPRPLAELEAAGNVVLRDQRLYEIWQWLRTQPLAGIVLERGQSRSTLYGFCVEALAAQRAHVAEIKAAMTPTTSTGKRSYRRARLYSHSPALGTSPQLSPAVPAASSSSSSSSSSPLPPPAQARRLLSTLAPWDDDGGGAVASPLIDDSVLGIGQTPPPPAAFEGESDAASSPSSPFQATAPDNSPPATPPAPRTWPRQAPPTPPSPARLHFVFGGTAADDERVLAHAALATEGAREALEARAIGAGTGAWARATAEDWRALAFQAVYTLTALAEVGLAHNDAHLRNIWLDEHAGARVSSYAVDDYTRFWTRTRLTLKFFDFDRATKTPTPLAPGERENGGLRAQDTCRAMGTCHRAHSRARYMNAFFDTFLVLTQLYWATEGVASARAMHAFVARAIDPQWIAHARTSGVLATEHRLCLAQPAAVDAATGALRPQPCRYPALAGFAGASGLRRVRALMLTPAAMLRDVYFAPLLEPPPYDAAVDGAAEHYRLASLRGRALSSRPGVF